MVNQAHHTKLTQRMTTTTPGGGTPTYLALSGAYNLLESFSVPSGSTFAVGVGPFPGTAFGYDAKFMSELAIAGATRASPACDPNTTNVANVCHMQITQGGLPVAQMQQLFSKAVHRARTAATRCELILDGATKFDPDRSRVSFVDSKGMAIKLVQGDPDGWDFDDRTTPTRIIFSGTACDGLALGETVKAEACEP